MSGDTGEKTELPTPKKIRKAREEGQVAHSKDLTKTVLFTALFGYMLADSEAVIRRLGEMMVFPVGLLGLNFADAVKTATSQYLLDAIRVVLPYLLIVIGLGLFIEMLQTGLLISFKAAMPSGKKLNVINNVKNVFSSKNLVDFLSSNIKIVVLSAVVYFILKVELGNLMTLPQAGVVGVGVGLGMLIKSLLIKVAVAYGVIAAADFAWQRFNYTREQKMTKEEVKQEYKESEGDPHIKHERRHLHQEMLAEGGAIHKSRDASVVVTNPTHLAVALKYDQDKTPLPLVLAKGEGTLAHWMARAARESGVPVLENVPLARALMEKSHVDQFIPSELIEPVAEVLRIVETMRREER